MAARKRKTVVFRTEEELADAVNEIVNDSDLGTDNIPEFSSSEESESESANESDNESDILTPDSSRRQIDVTPTTGSYGWSSPLCLYKLVWLIWLVIPVVSL